MKERQLEIYQDYFEDEFSDDYFTYGLCKCKSQEEFDELVRFRIKNLLRNKEYYIGYTGVIIKKKNKSILLKIFF